MKKTDDLGWLDRLNIPEDLRSRDYEFAGDRDALAALKALPGAGRLMGKWVEFWLEFSKTGFLGTAARVSQKQFPEVDALRLKCAQIIGVAAPPVFVVEQPAINAFTMGADEASSFVAVTRPLLEAASPRELAFILGHEFGHIKSQHALYATVATVLANMGLFYGSRLLPLHLLVLPLEMSLKAWFRRSEITCDRAGLIACQDLDAGRRALMLLGCCSRDLADRMDLAELQRQGEEASKSYGRFGELFLTHPNLPKRLRCLEVFAESHFYLRRIRGELSAPFLPPEEVDAAVGSILGNEAPVLDKMKENGDEARLKAVMALAGAWTAGGLNSPRRQALAALLRSRKLAAAEAKRLREHLDKPYPPERSLREARYFTGDRLQALPQAFSLLLLGTAGVSRGEIEFLMEVSAACGLSSDQAESVVFDVGFRKRFFRQMCGTDQCAACGRLLALSAASCAACGAAAASLDQPEAQRIRRLSERLEELGLAAAQAAARGAGGLLRALAGGMEATARLVEAGGGRSSGKKGGRRGRAG